MRGTPSTLSTGEIAAASIILYPNPASASFRIAGLETGGELKIWTATGKLVRTEHLTSFHPHVNVQDLPNGVYMIEIATPSASVAQRMVIAR
jgi:hypothetical protein